MAACYVMLSNIYVAVSNMCLCENVEWQRKEEGVKKQLGHTWIEVNNEMHKFIELTGSRPPPVHKWVKTSSMCRLSFFVFPLHFSIQKGANWNMVLRVLSLGFFFILGQHSTAQASTIVVKDEFSYLSPFFLAFIILWKISLAIGSSFCLDFTLCWCIPFCSKLPVGLTRSCWEGNFFVNANRSSAIPGNFWAH